MRRKVYRSLDHPAEFFGIRGRFIYPFLILMLLAVFFGIVVGGQLSLLFGIITGVVLTAVAYMYIIYKQTKIKEKALMKVLTKKLYPSEYHVRPKHIRNIWRGINLHNHFLKE